MVYCQYSSVYNIQKNNRELLVDTALCMDTAKGENHRMKRKLVAILTAACMTAVFTWGTATVWAAQEESAGKDEVVVMS